MEVEWGISPRSFGSVHGHVTRAWRNDSICGEKEISRYVLAGARRNCPQLVLAGYVGDSGPGLQKRQGGQWPGCSRPASPTDLKPALLPNWVLWFWNPEAVFRSNNEENSGPPPPLPLFSWIGSFLNEISNCFVLTWSNGLLIQEPFPGLGWVAGRQGGRRRSRPAR